MRSREKPCDADGCITKAYRQGYCRKHFVDDRECSLDYCDRMYYARGYCNAHYKQLLDGRDFTPIKPYGLSDSGWYMNPQGYVVRVRMDDGGVLRREQQHRVIMEQYLGRSLVGAENVHHVNGDRSDNRLSNLELWSVSQPSGQRVLDKLEWAREIIELYEPQEELLRDGLPEHSDSPSSGD